jgi:hypothetical protein
VSLALVAVGTIVALIGGGKSDSTSSQIVSSTTTVTENASTDRTDAPTSLGNTQAPATSSQSVAITTTVPQNASTGSAGRPTAVTTPIMTTPIVTTTTTTTLADSDSRRQMVTDLQISKSHPVFYDWPLNLQQTVTFTAKTKNVEQVGALYLMMKFSDGWAPAQTLSQVQSGIWKGTVEFGTKGVFEFCVRLLDTCDGPTVSVEVLERDQNPPTISDITISTAVIYPGVTFRVRARIVDESGVRSVLLGIQSSGTGGGNCEVGTLESGDLKDGVWSADCVIISTEGEGQLQVNIRAMDDYRYLVSDSRYPITVQYNP